MTDTLVILTELTKYFFKNMNNMWQLNLDSTVQIKELMGSKIYQIDNVFKEPKKLYRFLFNRQSFAVQGEPWTRNQYFYQKERYTDFKDASAPLAVVAERLCGQHLGNYGAFSTNIESWQTNAYNLYETHYWWPHLDNGYTCIVYFNKETTNGTNLYHPNLKEKDWFKNLMADDIPKGKQPWISKEDVELVTELTPAYNRMVLFDGAYFPHGSAVNNLTYFSDQPKSLNCRKNLCFFYYPNENKKETK